MDFLRRLHPRHADATGAVRPDLGAWRAAGLPRRVAASDQPGEMAPEPAQPGTASPSSPFVAEPAHAIPAPGAKNGRPAASLVALDTAGLQGARPVPAAGEALAAVPAGEASAPSLATSTHALSASALPARPVTPAGPARTSPMHAPERPQGDDRPGAAAARAAPPALAASALRTGPASSLPPPLRADVQALQRAPDAAAPTVVQVTIDRIDVRLPPERAPAAAPSRPRPAPTVALADYLRERDGGRR